jgi:mannonate dehydratase
VQLGATEVVGGNGLPTDQGYYTVADMRLLRERVEEAGLRLTVISGLPEELTYKIKLGLPGRDEQIDNWRKTLRNMGEAGIDTLVYFFSLRSW